MATRLPARRVPPIGFAHRGGRGHGPDNVLETFELGLRLGATGVETDAWVTRDGHAVLDHDGVVGGRLRRRAIRDLDRADLPDHVPTLEDLYERCGSDYELAVDLKDPDAVEPIVATARSAGGGAAGRLWLCHHDWRRVATWRAVAPEARLVDSTRLRKIREGPERRAAALADAGIDAVNLHHSDWTGGLTTLFHRFERECLAWDAQYPRILEGLVDMGIDGMFSDHVDRLMEAVAKAAA